MMGTKGRSQSGVGALVVRAPWSRSYHRTRQLRQKPRLGGKPERG